MSSNDNTVEELMRQLAAKDSEIISLRMEIDNIQQRLKVLLLDVMNIK